MKSSDGYDCITFAENHCRISNSATGKLETAHLRDWQKQFLIDVLETDDEGCWKYREGLFELPRKNGKTLLGAIIALFGLFFGPADAEIYSVAGDYKQAGICFQMAKKMVQRDPELSQLAKIYEKAIHLPGKGSVYRVLSADAGLQEGLNPYLVIFDEVHVQPTDELWNVMRLGMGARKSAMLLGISTAGVMTGRNGEDSLCYSKHQYGLKVESGEIKDDHFFFRWYGERSLDCDYRQPAVWESSNPGYNDWLQSKDFEQAVNTTPESEFRIKRLCQWVKTKLAWLPFGVWEACKHENFGSPATGTEICLGFDGSYSDDSTALVGCVPGDIPHLFVIGAWEKPKGERDWHVRRDEVDMAVRQAFQTWRIQKFWPDPPGWAKEIEAWEDDYGSVVDRFPTATLSRMAPLVDDFYVSVMQRQVTHDGDLRLGRHLGNMVIRETLQGTTVTKESKYSSRKIDLGIAAILALGAARSPDPPQPFILF